MSARASRFGALACVGALATTACSAPVVKATARAWPDADKLFRGDARFLGADSAYSAPLPGGRVLWMFGDTFVAKGVPSGVVATRHDAVMVHNSVAVQTGLDPSSAQIAHFFGGTVDAPASFFADDGERYTWPGTPALVDGKLLLFLWTIAKSDGGLGFAFLGARALLVDNPGDDPPAWHTTALSVPAAASTGGFALGTGGTLVDGDALYLLAAREPGDHQMALARVSVQDAARGDLSHIVWLADDGAFLSLDSAHGASTPRALFAGQTELSLTHTGGAFEVVGVDGFGAVPVVMRSSARIDGPWSAAGAIYAPPEATRATKGAIVYSAKAHPELRANGANGANGSDASELIVTYCSNSTDLATVVNDDTLYFPRFLRVSLEKR